ncbi:hypothetical protein QEN19_004047 [Hanseniaspora menglaensis]
MVSPKNGEKQFYELDQLLVLENDVETDLSEFLSSSEKLAKLVEDKNIILDVNKINEYKENDKFSTLIVLKMTRQNKYLLPENLAHTFFLNSPELENHISEHIGISVYCDFFLIKRKIIVKSKFLNKPLPSLLYKPTELLSVTINMLKPQKNNENNTEKKGKCMKRKKNITVVKA